MSDRIFVDTNILVYAYDLDAGAKHERAKKKVLSLWRNTEPPAISVQVLQEFYVNLIRLGADHADARETVSDYTSWRVMPNTVSLLESGIDESERWQLSFWDGLILAAARESDASLLWSEDLSAGQDYDGVIVHNPLAS